jgi:hypothetical protein
MNCRKSFANRGFLAGAFLTIAPIIVAFAILTAAAPAFAQSSLDSSSAPATDYVLPPPEAGSLAVPATPDEAIPSDATSSVAVATKPSATVKPLTAADSSSDASAAAHSGWDRVGDVYTDTDNEDQADKVLEVPQVLPPDNPQPSDDADQTAQEGGSQSPDQVGSIQVGSIEDYQEEEDGALMGVYGVPVLLGPVGINPYGVSGFHAPIDPSFRPGFQRGFVPIVPRPFGGGMNSAILPTSPMFPSGSARFSGGMRFSRGMGFSGGMRGGRR